MSAEILSFPRLGEVEEPAKFHCDGEVVEHCFRQIGVDDELAQKFLDEMERVKYRIMPEWLLLAYGVYE